MKKLNKNLKSPSLVASISLLILLFALLQLNVACNHSKWNPVLSSLEVNGKSLSIANSMDAGTTTKAKVAVIAKTLASRASISFEPSLDEKGKWELKLGENTLKITVNRGKKRKEYYVKITRNDGTSLLKKLSINGKTFEKEELNKNEVFTVGVFGTMQSVKFEAEPDVPGATITCNPELDDDSLPLSAGRTTEVLITVENQGSKREYKAIIKKIADVFAFSAGTQNGEEANSLSDDAIRIFSHDSEATISLPGPKAVFYAGTKLMAWTSFKINGIEYQKRLAEYKDFHSVLSLPIDMGAKGTEANIELEIEAKEVENGKIKQDDPYPIRETFSFTLTRNDEKVDLPFGSLVLDGENVTPPQSFQVQQLLNGNGLDFESGEDCVAKIIVTEEIESATIAGKSATISKQTNKDKKDIWVAEASVSSVSYDGTKVECILHPKDKDAYQDTKVTFKLKRTDPLPLEMDYSINGISKKKLPDAFNQAIENDESPLIKVAGSYLNLSLTVESELESVKINDVALTKDKIVVFGGEKTKRSRINYSLDLAGGEQEIKLELNPLYKGRFLKKVVKFKAKGDGIVPKIEPLFISIGGDKNLQKASFLNKLSGSEVPTYGVCIDTATVVLSLSEYAHNFLVDKVLVNGETVSLVKRDLKLLVEYVLQKDISNIDASGKLVKIEFKGKNGASDLTWQFRIRKIETLPSLPQEKISLFSINEFGGEKGTPFTEDFEAGLADDAVKPVFEFYGNKAKVCLGTGDASLLKNVKFSLDGTEKATVIPISKNSMMQAEYEFVLEDVGREHEVEIVMNPTTVPYSPLKYTFKLKSLDSKTSPKYGFAVNGLKKASGYKGKVKGERANLLVQVAEDVMEKVEVIVDGGSPKNCRIEHFESSTKIWEAGLDVDLSDTEKTFTIRVTPKSTSTHPVVECKYYLTGIAASSSNAEFAFKANGKPDVSAKIKWLSGLEANKYNDDYGAKTVTIIAKTVSSKAKVHWQVVDLINNRPISGTDKSGIMQAGTGKGAHVANDVVLYEDKPTKIKMWVVSENGSMDAVYGTFYFVYNPVLLWWSYSSDIGDKTLRHKAWDVVNIDKTRVKNGKIYLAFLALKPSYGYKVNNSGLPQGQSTFKDKGELGESQQLYTCSVDVSTLVSGAAQHVDALFKMTSKGIECINYKVKIEAN